MEPTNHLNKADRRNWHDPFLILARNAKVPETTVSHKRTLYLRESGGGTSTKGIGTVDRHRHRVRVDRAGRSLEDRKQMDDFIYQVFRTDIGLAV